MKREDTTLILLTFNYPFGNGEQFIATELDFLLQKFDRVILMPFNAYGSARPVPERVVIDLSIKRPENKFLYFIEIALRGLTNPLLRQEIAHDPSSSLSISRLLRLVQFLGNAVRISKRILSVITIYDINLESTIFYTYWISFLSYGLGLAKSVFPNLILISRAHSGDIYEIQQHPPFFPFRMKTLSLIDRIYCVSSHAKQYLSKSYPSVKNHFEVSKLGVIDPGFEAGQSADGTFRIITNSYLTPIKRIDLFIKGLGIFANSNPFIQIEWHHIGDGSLRKYLENLARLTIPDNVNWSFLGYIPHSGVYQFYHTYPIDVMVNVSKSEAISVSMMEAQSCGIPVIATSVGGTPEIITNSNGILLESDPTPEDIANALRYIANNKDAALTLRRESKNTWKSAFNARTNYQDFANKIFNLIS